MCEYQNYEARAALEILLGVQLFFFFLLMGYPPARH
jgi:hypothetical protein